MSVTTISLSGPQNRKARGARSLERAQQRTGVILAAPAAALLVALSLGPAVLVILLSLTDYQFGFKTLKFIGLENYAELFNSRSFWNSLRNTAIYVGIVVPGSVLLGLGIAILIESRSVMRRLFSVAYFLPVTAMLVAAATAWEVILHPNFGLANLLISAFGYEKLRFLSDPDLALFTLAGIGVWELVGFNMVLFMAGLATIPRELYEAASIDGADRGVRRFLLVIWPMLGPTAMFVLILTAIRAFRVFETVAVLTAGGPNKATEVILYTLFTEGFRYFRIGYASALAVVFLVFAITLTLMQLRFFDRRVHYE